MTTPFTQSDQDLARGVESCNAIITEGVTIPPWFHKTKTCHLLDTHLIKHCGIVTARAPFHIVRTNPSGCYFLACHQGQGNVMFEGHWKTISAGEACLLPPHTCNSLHVSEKQSWSYSWVRFHENNGNHPGSSTDKPIFNSFDSHTLRTALQGLILEANRSKPSQHDQHHWVELINSHVIRFHSLSNLDERLRRVWQTASQDLAADWSLNSLADLANMSSEHFRRLNQKQLHRSPIKHLTYLRMSEAARLLLTTDEKVATIADTVGYHNAFSFSNAFNSHFGRRPSNYRSDLSSS